ncbi:hypothetical protein ACA910_009402 [Epithemia clementina (nom. ined.)]
MIALGHARPKSGLAYRMQLQQQHALLSNNSDTPFDGPIWLVSLQEVCRNVIVANLERYPPEAFGMLEEEEWNLLLKYRHEKTKPKKSAVTITSSSTGGGQRALDETGRMAPALSDKFLAAVEQCHPDEKVRESKVADELLWKDCVNYSFRQGGLTRPRVLEFPWPLLVERVQRAAETIWTVLPTLLRVTNGNDDDDDCCDDEQAISTKEEPAMQELRGALSLLENTPVNVKLLLDSGAGKTIKKVFKKLQQQQQTHQCHHSLLPDFAKRVECLLASWKDVAQQEGVDVQSQPSVQPPTAKKPKKAPPSSSSSAAASSSKTASPSSAQHVDTENEKADWERAEACQSWRQLFAALKLREETRRTKQGQRMREIRKHLNHDRPKIVKVQRATEQHNRILSSDGNKPKGTFGASIPAGASTQNSKMTQLKREAQVVACRQNRGESANVAALARLQHQQGGPKTSMFSMAVAGAAGAKKSGGAKRKVMNGGTTITTNSSVRQTNAVMTFPNRNNHKPKGVAAAAAAAVLPPQRRQPVAGINTTTNSKRKLLRK